MPELPHTYTVNNLIISPCEITERIDESNEVSLQMHGRVGRTLVFSIKRRRQKGGIGRL